jgi:hypothetical protein
VKPLQVKASALRLRTRPEEQPGTDSGRRALRDEVVQGLGQSYDGRWHFIVAPQGEGWASAQFLQDAPAGDLTVGWPRVPHGLVAIRGVFGEPANPAAYGGRARLPDFLPLSWDKRQRINSFACHRLLVAPFESAFAAVHERGLWHLLEDFGGCYNDRTARGLQKKSTHAWGIAVDVAVGSNPLGAKPKLDSRIVTIFEDRGFYWGGRFSRPDGMHFQYATGY